MINGGGGGDEGRKERKPSEKEEYKEGDDETTEMAEEKEGRDIAMLLSHLLGRRRGVAAGSPFSYAHTGNGPRATVSGVGRREEGRRCAVIMRKEGRMCGDGDEIGFSARQHHQVPDDSNPICIDSACSLS